MRRFSWRVWLAYRGYAGVEAEVQKPAWLTAWGVGGAGVGPGPLRYVQLVFRVVHMCLANLLSICFLPIGLFCLRLARSILFV